MEETTIRLTYFKGVLSAPEPYTLDSDWRVLSINGFNFPKESFLRDLYLSSVVPPGKGSNERADFVPVPFEVSIMETGTDGYAISCFRLVALIPKPKKRHGTDSKSRKRAQERLESAEVLPGSG